MKDFLAVAFLACLMASLPIMLISQDTQQKQRVIILTDIEADPDDTQSLVRLLLYANQLDIKGLVATTSCWLQAEIHPESIRKIIRAYGQVKSNKLKPYT